MQRTSVFNTWPDADIRDYLELNHVSTAGYNARADLLYLAKSIGRRQSSADHTLPEGALQV